MNFSDIDQLPPPLRAVATYRTLNNEQTLFHRDAEASAIYAVKSGQIRLLHYTQDGHPISHYAVYRGELCAEAALFLGTYTCNALAEEPTQVLVLPKQAFLMALQQDSAFAMAFMAQLAKRLHMTEVTLELRGIRSAQERVLHYLLLAMPPGENTVVLEQPLKNIAYDLGISPEVLSRALAQLVKKGMIAREKRRITLLQSSQQL